MGMGAYGRVIRCVDAGLGATFLRTLFPPTIPCTIRLASRGLEIKRKDKLSRW